MKLIAETAWHHDGDFTFMKNLIDKLISDSEADIIKLHLSFDFDEYFFKDHPGYSVIKSKALDKKQWDIIVNKIKNSDKELMLLFNDREAVDFGMQYNPAIVEIHSVCLNDIHLLEKLKKSKPKDTPIVLGVGGSSLYEIENAISYLEDENIVLMHGFQNYPTQYRNINFRKIKKTMQLYPLFKHGYADHTAWNEHNNVLITSMAAAIGMDYIEKHVTTSPGEERIDWQAAVSIETFNHISNNLKILDACNGDGLLKLNEGEKQYSVFGPNKKAAFSAVNIKKGDVLSVEMICFKRTSQITNVSQVEALELVGKIAQKDIPQGVLLELKDFK